MARSSKAVSPGGSSGPAARLVAAAAIVVDGRVLAARRTAPPPVAGRWELPGGKVEAGESPEQAAVREVREELGVTVTAGRRIGRRHPIRPGLALVVVLAELVGEPPASSVVHDELRWLGPRELGDVDWLPADRPLLPLLRQLLEAAGPARPAHATAAAESTAAASAAGRGEPVDRAGVATPGDPGAAPAGVGGGRSRQRRRARARAASRRREAREGAGQPVVTESGARPDPPRTG